MHKILLIHGPNLNLLGSREPDLYGSTTLEEINVQMINQGKKLGYDIIHYQSNAEHDIVNSIQEAISEEVTFIIINPAAFTHTSVAIRDALLGVNIPFIEVHLTNTDARESFRKASLLADIAVGRISGFGPFSYQLALEAANHHLKHNKG